MRRLPQRPAIPLRPVRCLAWLLVVVTCGGAGAACGPRSRGADGPAEVATQVAESSRYGQDRVTGILQVSPAEAYFDGEAGKIRIVSAAPVTAVGVELLLAQTARSVQDLAGKRVRAEGDLQGTLLWEARLTSAE